MDYNLVERHALRVAVDVAAREAANRLLARGKGVMSDADAEDFIEKLFSEYG